MPIQQLPTLVVNQIAAGEVIERPASVVKELVENALDAGATRIDVAVEKGGSQLIRVSDDGVGMTAEDLPLAVSSHATSKLGSAEQLEAVRTFGFRGEALASIGSVSRLRLTTRPTVNGQTAEAGTVLQTTGDQIAEPSPTAASPGSVVEVRDLFFNTPARRKFLRTASTEFGHIHDTLCRIAICHPDVGFGLTHNERTTFDLPPNQSRAERSISVLGGEIAEAVLEFERTDSPKLTEPEARLASVWGLAGMPQVARSSGKFQYLAVNGRPVRDRNLSHALREAYRGLIPPEKFPLAVVMLEVDPAAVDVNVHPAKAEVRFRNPSHVHGLVLAALRQRLLGADLTPRAAMNHQKPTALRSDSDGFGESSAPADSAASAQPGRASGPGSDAPAVQTASGWGSANRQADFAAAEADAADPTAFVNYFKRMAPEQKGFVYQQVKRELQEQDASDSDADERAPTRSGINGHAEQGGAAADHASNLRPESILQVHDSYVVTQDDQGLLIVDQHALHERVMFEELSRRVFGQEGGGLESQRLLMPEMLNASPRRQTIVEQLDWLLQRIGVELTALGPQQLAIQAFPSFLFSRRVEPGPFLEELLDKVEQGDLEIEKATSEEAALHEVLDMMACKAAVKAGDHMTRGELESLLQRRGEVERASNCPHGRPTTLRLTLADLEKQFGRS